MFVPVTFAKLALTAALPFLGVSHHTPPPPQPPVHAHVLPHRVQDSPVTMYDSANPASIPTGLSSHDIIAYYNTGNWPWPQSAVNAARAHHHVVAIDVNGSDPHDPVLDIEPGDATPQASVTWVHEREALHPRYVPVLYANRSYYPQVIAAQRAAGNTPGKDFKMWVSTANPAITSYGPKTWSIGTQNVWKPGFDSSVIHSSGFVNAYGGGKG